MMIKKQEFWQEFMTSQTEALPQPTLLDISTTNPTSLFDQMMTYTNDFYRKQFILQTCFVMSFIERFITSEDIRTFYKTCFQKDSTMLNVNFDNFKQSDPKSNKISTFCHFILKKRILHFYSTRDPVFTNLIQKLLDSDSLFLDTKVDSFKNFQNFVLPEERVMEVKESDYSFKKFGFIKLGNKAINNIWKIETGLNNINRPTSNSETLFDELREKWQLKSTNNEFEKEHQPKDMIVKRWQLLRSLRGQYLFNFNQLNEDVGIDGLFDASLMQQWTERKNNEKLEDLAHKEKIHNDKLQAARSYMAERENKKRASEEGAEEPPTKIAKIEKDGPPVQSLIEATESEINNGKTASNAITAAPNVIESPAGQLTEDTTAAAETNNKQT